ncbi:hypothetical protein OB69_05380 [Roseivirga seohaensis subsp. aquiponti]|uniref:Uncharacterized protein n=2 Tax=Roseivirga seohaensis TaxID=1914963 RepID=A0A0L8ANB7_9BACT|nr:hypothetical protein OB69_05380 [Roseivirga seohaensis subsp. aquiponti]
MFLGKSFSQEVELPVFLDGCKNFEKADSLMFLTVNGEATGRVSFKESLVNEGINFISGSNQNGLEFTVWFYSDESLDTLELPRFRIQYTGGMHNMSYKHMYCDDVADGLIVDLSKKGVKKLEGNFSQGKPLWLSTFNQEGKLFLKEYYYRKTHLLKRIEYYDGANAYRYEEHKFRGKNTLLIYYENGEIVKKEKSKSVKTRNGIIR